MLFQDISEKISTLRDKMQRIDDKIKAIEVTKEAGAGLVKATINGEKRVLNLHIDEQLLNKEDKVMLQDLVIASLNLAIDEVEERIKGEKEEVSMELFGALPQE